MKGPLMKGTKKKKGGGKKAKGKKKIVVKTDPPSSSEEETAESSSIDEMTELPSEEEILIAYTDFVETSGLDFGNILTVLAIREISEDEIPARN